MKTLFSTLCVALLACVSLANEPTPAASEPQSVLAAKPEAVIATLPENAPTANASNVCVGESCTTCRSACRDGLFGRTITRSREVTRNVVEAAVVVPTRVVTAPVRVFRTRRGCCCR